MSSDELEIEISPLGRRDLAEVPPDAHMLTVLVDPAPQPW